VPQWAQDILNSNRDSEALNKLASTVPEGAWEFLRRESGRHPPEHDESRQEHEKRQAAATLELLRLFRPCGNCTTYHRYGSAHAGGYVMCAELMQGAKAAYSFGIQGNDDWGVSVSQALGGAPVHEFDCYRAEHPVCPRGVACELHFRQECLGLPFANNESHTFRSFHEHISRHSALVPDEEIPVGGDLVMKVDVEGKEWNAFLDARLQDLRRMRQIVVEFHAVSRVEFHEFFVKTLRRILKAGFVVVHIHGSNMGSMALFGDGRFKLADNLQVTFANKLAQHAGGGSAPGAKRTCVRMPTRLPTDAPDNPYNFDLPLPELAGENDTIIPSRLRVMKCHWWCSVFAVVMGLGPFISLTLIILMGLFLLGLVLWGGCECSPGRGFSLKKRTGYGRMHQSVMS
jgi:hypothetical protein